MAMPYNKMAVKMGYKELIHLREIIKTPQGGLVTTAQKIRGDPEGIGRTIKAVLLANRYLKQNKGEFTKLLAKESGVHDPVVAGLIHEEILNLYSDTGLVSEEAIQEFIANSKETLKSSREILSSDVADFSFARKAVGELKESK
jgi:ABC-type nitrate/sulfonate/bicarbonate transport system substrate-binding protein